MRHYPSKLLLFGEHVLLLGARALAVPVSGFSGKWARRAPGEPAGPFYDRLSEFARSPELAGISGLRVDVFQHELAGGLFFQSNIPTGYGLGSSGALCAAVFDRFAAQKPDDPAELKEIFARMESFFHGKSSGIDPLTSYLNRPIWIENRIEVRSAETPAWDGRAPVIFLLDSGLPRQTGPLVQWFLGRSQEPGFAGQLNAEYLPAHRRLLDAWSGGDTTGFWSALHRISTLQPALFPPMIPGGMSEIWNRCLHHRNPLLKVCGAGGGGYVLGFAESRDEVLERIPEFAPIFPFE